MYAVIIIEADMTTFSPHIKVKCIKMKCEERHQTIVRNVKFSLFEGKMMQEKYKLGFRFSATPDQLVMSQKCTGHINGHIISHVFITLSGINDFLVIKA